MYNLNEDTSDSSHDGNSKFTGPTPDRNYSISIDPDPDGIDRAFYMIKVNGNPVACALGESSEAFRNAQLIRLQLEDELDGFDWLEQAWKFSPSELGA
jgi:hypothetical protein